MAEAPKKKKKKPATSSSPATATAKQAVQKQASEPQPPPSAWEETTARVLTASRPYLPFAVLGGAALLGYLRGPGAGVLVVAGGAMVLAISMLWTSIRTLAGDVEVDLDAAVAIGSTTTEDEKKRRILQALKDLEIEHRLGKVSDDDFRLLSGQYRAEAKRILQEIDQKIAPARALAEQLVASRLIAPPPGAGDETSDADDANEADESSAEDVATACPTCRTKNEADAVFCKKCGHRLLEET